VAEAAGQVGTLAQEAAAVADQALTATVSVALEVPAVGVAARAEAEAVAVAEAMWTRPEASAVMGILAVTLGLPVLAVVAVEGAALEAMQAALPEEKVATAAHMAVVVAAVVAATLAPTRPTVEVAMEAQESRVLS